MIKNWFEWEKDNRKEIPKLHPTQKPIAVLKRLIEIFTDEGDVVIDPVAGSASTLRAARELNRPSYGFEIKKDSCKIAKEQMLNI
ncbi:methylase [Haemophilus influenzae HK1212]|uniref:Methylase n=2 Tax=Haemophilus influenzae HK1212 TaxID=456482 RepID=A0A7G2K066_HAEIF|nr:methylase [Haemophilus influenzae HK1212]